MKVSGFSISLLAAALTLASAGASAQTASKSEAAAAKSDAAAAKELAAARADLARAAKRVAELSQKTAQAEWRIAQIEKIRARRPVLGVVLTPDEGKGVRIAAVTPSSAAAKAGLRSGDRIVTINGVQVLGNTGELRVLNARKLLGKLDDKSPAKIGYVRAGRDAVISLTPEDSNSYVVMFDGLDGDPGTDGPIDISWDADTKIAKFGERSFHFDGVKVDPPIGLSPEIEKELTRLSAMEWNFDPCKGDNCKVPALLSAFRWNGLNLASVDAQLGRYFGTDKGVLVLSNGDIAGLQPGDVIQRIDGKTVDNPREAMDVLRDKPADATANVAYLRDRKSATARIKVPKLMAFPPVPPVPPRPPSPPKPPVPPKPPAAMKAPAPPAPPVPPKPPAVGSLSVPNPAVAWVDEDVHYAYVSEDGKTTAFAWTVDDTEPKAAAPVEDTTR